MPRIGDSSELGIWGALALDSYEIMLCCHSTCRLWWTIVAPPPSTAHPAMPMRACCACRFEQERSMREQHEEQLRDQQQQQQRLSWLEAAAGAMSASPPGSPPASPPAAPARQLSAHDRSVSVCTAVGAARAAAGVSRRHTAPALRAPATLSSPELLSQLSNTASHLEELRRELERDLEAGAAADGSLALSRLSSLLHACSFLRDASAAACSRRASVDMADEAGQRGAPPCAGDQEVALHDDGAAGVGATAAAAVSVALAQSWAAAAGARQASFRHAAAAEGRVRPGKARFKLVAAVPRSYHGGSSRREQARSEKLAAVSAPAGGSVLQISWTCAKPNRRPTEGVQFTLVRALRMHVHLRQGHAPSFGCCPGPCPCR